jgi:hypothetical protein
VTRLATAEVVVEDDTGEAVLDDDEEVRLDIFAVLVIVVEELRADEVVELDEVVDRRLEVLMLLVVDEATLLEVLVEGPFGGVTAVWEMIDEEPDVQIYMLDELDELNATAQLRR